MKQWNGFLPKYLDVCSKEKKLIKIDEKDEGVKALPSLWRQNEST